MPALNIEIQYDLTFGPVAMNGIEGHYRGSDQRPGFLHTHDPHQFPVRESAQISSDFVTVTLIYPGLLSMYAGHLLMFAIRRWLCTLSQIFCLLSPEDIFCIIPTKNLVYLFHTLNRKRDGKDKRLEKNIFTKLPRVFTSEPLSDEDIRVLGIVNNKRVWKYIPNKYIELEHENLLKYKVLLPTSNGSGAIGEVLSTPLVGTPLVGYTRSFIGICSFDNINEAENCLKYIKTKFARACLGILKITQDNNRDVWKYVPLQDFTSNSDIDWSKSESEIDKQLYSKYRLTSSEIDFIEQRVQEMN